jgi:hypothetical protein
MTIKELIQARDQGKTIYWFDPDPIKGNDYRVTHIKDLEDYIEFNDDQDLILTIQYNSGLSEAEVLLGELDTREL